MSKLKYVVAVVLSFPLVACASQGGSIAGPVSAGGGSGGSPLAGSPTFSSDSAVASSRAPLRDVAATHEASPRYELRVHEVLTCRQCK
jgi:hypothetical protein